MEVMEVMGLTICSLVSWLILLLVTVWMINLSCRY